MLQILQAIPAICATAAQTQCRQTSIRSMTTYRTPESCLHDEQQPSALPHLCAAVAAAELWLRAERCCMLPAVRHHDMETPQAGELWCCQLPLPRSHYFHMHMCPRSVVVKCQGCCCVRYRCCRRQRPLHLTPLYRCLPPNPPINRYTRDPSVRRHRA